MRNIKSLFHINIPTNHFEEMIRFYVDICGFDQAFIITQADMKRMFGQPVLEGDEKIAKNTYIRVNPHSYIELHNIDPAEKIIRCDPASAFHHFAVLTEDLEKTCRNMAAKGYPLINDPLNKKPVQLNPFLPHVGEDGCLIAWMEDPDGHFIEVMQLSGTTMQEQFENENPIEDALAYCSGKEFKNFNHLFHLALHVTDLERSVAFYNKLGCEKVFSLDFPDGRPWLTYVRLNKLQYLELFQIYPDHPMTPRDHVSHEKDDFFGHLSFLVPDIYKAATDWAEKGVHVVYAPFKPEPMPLEDDSVIRGRVGADRNYICWVNDPDGNWVEIMEELDDSWQKVFEENTPF